MSLFGMSAMAFWLGLLGLAAGLFGLHLLRVRLRRVDVDTLLFFRLAGALQKPRVLPGRPARWLAYLLGLLVLGLAWLTVAAPRSGLDAASRLVVLQPGAVGGGAGDAGGLVGAEALAAVHELRQRGLGPRGAIYAATMPPTLLYAAGEAVGLLTARFEALPGQRGASSGTAAAAAACLAVAALARSGDELWWVGSTPPPSEGGFRHHALPAPQGELLQARWRREADARYTLCLRLRSEGASLAVMAGATELARATAPPGLQELYLGPVALPAAAADLTLRSDAFANALPLQLPPPPIRVAALDLPAAWSQMLAAAVAADPELEWVSAPGEAAVLVATDDDPADLRPRLVLAAGVGDGPRRAVLSPAVSLPLSLRDQRRRSAPALPEVPGALVWVFDAEQGQALVQALSPVDWPPNAPTRPPVRVQVVDWLLQPTTHADLPVLLTTALRELGGDGVALQPVPGQPLWQPCLLPQRPTRFGMQPVAGALPLHFQSSTADLGWRAASRTAPAAAVPPATNTIGGAGLWAPWLLACLLVLCLIDAVLFHRARLP